MAAPSPDLLWSIIRNNNSYMLKNNGKQFTREPNNIKNINSYRYSGLVHKKTVGVEYGKNRKGVVFVMKKNGKKQVNKKSYTRVALNKNPRATLNSIRNMMKNSHYRKDLKMPAMRRACALLRSQKPVAVKKTGKKPAKSSK